MMWLFVWIAISLPLGMMTGKWLKEMENAKF